MLNFYIAFYKENSEKSEKVPNLGIFFPKTILMFRVGLKKIMVGRPIGTTHTFHLSIRRVPQKGLEGEQLTGSERLLTINTQVHICIIFAGKEQQVM